jgi:predicted acyl esterase
MGRGLREWRDLLFHRDLTSRSLDFGRSAAFARDDMMRTFPLSPLLAFSLFAATPATAQDRAWYDTTAVTAQAPVQWIRRSIHIPMRDGVRIAADIYLPSAGMGSIPPLPTMLHQTRYRRGLQFKDSTREASAPPPYGLMPFLQAGYAVVITDVRGTGASFGSRTTEFSPDEVRDGWDVLDWIVAQSWSDGNVGAMGISYPGTRCGGRELFAGLPGCAP